jgi:mRNA interferase RelE/StbE
LSRRVDLTRAALGDLRGLDKGIARRVLDALDRLGADGLGDVRRLQGIDPPEWRLRVGDWRVRLAFEGDDETGAVRVLRVMHRREVYRD